MKTFKVTIKPTPDSTLTNLSVEADGFGIIGDAAVFHVGKNNTAAIRNFITIEEFQTPKAAE